MVHPGCLLDELGEALVSMHCLVKSAQKVLVELFFRLTIQLVIFLKECFLRPNLHTAKSCARFSDAPTLVTTTVLWCCLFYLLSYRLPWIDLIDHSKEAGEFSAVTR